MSLLIDQSIAQLEQVLLDAITFGLKKIKLTSADAAALRAVPTMGAQTPLYQDEDLVFVTANGNKYRWSQASTSADDGDLVVKPTDAAATGRWLKVVTTLLFDDLTVVSKTDGPLKNVVLHNGDFDEEVLKSRIYGKRPCVAIHFAGERHVPISQISGALYDYRVRFELWSVSSNYRDKFEAAIGSPIPAEAADDPGVMKIHGLVKKLLAGKEGEELGQTGVKKIELFEGELIEAREAERLFVMSLGVEIQAAIHNPDNPAVLVTPSEIDVQRNIVQAPGPKQFTDTSDCVTQGLDVPQQIGFAGTVNAGAALVGTTPVAVIATANTFAASSDTYRDLTPAGTWVFTAVALRAMPPAPLAGNLRVGVTTTDEVGIVNDAFLCSVEEPYPAANTPDIIPIS